MEGSEGGRLVGGKRLGGKEREVGIGGTVLVTEVERREWNRLTSYLFLTILVCTPLPSNSPLSHLTHPRSASTVDRLRKATMAPTVW